MVTLAKLNHSHCRRDLSCRSYHHLEGQLWWRPFSKQRPPGRSTHSMLVGPGRRLDPEPFTAFDEQSAIAHWRLADAFGAWHSQRAAGRVSLLRLRDYSVGLDADQAGHSSASG